MYDATDFQVRYSDHQRQIAKVNETAWQFDPPTTGTGIRGIVAQALVALATRLFPTALESGETASAPRADAGFPRNATIA